MIWYSSNLYIWLIFKAKLKVTKGQGLQVKGQGVNNAIMLKNCHGYKSQRDDWILIKLIHMIDINTLFKMAKCQGHKVKVKYKIIWKSDWAENHEQKTRSWLNLYVGLVSVKGYPS